MRECSYSFQGCGNVAFEAIKIFFHNGCEKIQYISDVSGGIHMEGGTNEGMLSALKEHFERIYEIEGGKIEIEFSEDEMTVQVESCPAVMYLREKEYPVAELFVETTKTVNEVLCEGSEFSAELVEYDPQTGRSVQRFWRSRS